MPIAVLPDDAFEFAILHHILTEPEDLADLWPIPTEPMPCAAA